MKVYCNNDLYEIEQFINDWLQISDESIAHINYQVSNGYHTVIVVFTKQGEMK
jgi:hypothetical protein